MSEYHAVVEWSRDGAAFTDNRYSRGHQWSFDGGIEVRASASPHVVPLPMSVAEAVDPEEAFVASLSSCHMLFFLALAAKRGFVVDRYRDDAVHGGLLEQQRLAAARRFHFAVGEFGDLQFGGYGLRNALEFAGAVECVDEVSEGIESHALRLTTEVKLSRFAADAGIET